MNLVEPMMKDARLQLQARAEKIKQDYAAAPFDPARAVDALSANLPGRLLMMIAKTMVLELHVARLEGVLQGATPADRFASFTERLSRTDIALKLLSEYPVLARRLAGCIDNWIIFSAEFLERLAVDWNEIVKLFNIGPECGVLMEAAAGAGDTHRRGRSVLIARFEGGLQLVYKPRSISVDQHFQDFIRWVNEKGANPQLRTLKVLDRETMGGWNSSTLQAAAPMKKWSAFMNGKESTWPSFTSCRPPIFTLRTFWPAVSILFWWTWKRCFIHGCARLT